MPYHGRPMRISGELHNGALAEMRIDRVKCGNQVTWQQRTVTPSAAHLHRDYVCNESIHDIIVNWLPCDWKKYTIHRDEEALDAALWSAMVEDDA